MKRILDLLTSLPAMALAGALAIAALSWYLALLAGLEPGWARLAVAAAAPAAWAGWMAWRAWARRRAETALAGGLSDDVGEEQEAVRVRFAKALDLLRTSEARAGGLPLSELPWYVIVGPPGSGKTTALENSGLRFPLAAAMGKEPVRGVGGTRLCDWWFAEDAVLIDTAGRYTTQDSNTAVDRAGWTAFLDLLKKHRPTQPVNGVLVAISVADLLDGSADDRLAHARAVRARLLELIERAGTRVPIYVLFTKADLVAGFTETFDTLTEDERAQVFGMTFPLDDPQDGHPDGDGSGRFAEEFDRLVERLNGRLLQRVHQERDHDRRSLIFAFPAQLATLREAARQFLDEAFLRSRYEAQPLLRGVYFASGTQVGTPTDRLMGALAATFGLRPVGLPAFAGRGRSYFLKTLLRRVVFAESGLVDHDPRAQARLRRLRRAAFAGLGAAAVVAGGLWTASFLDNQRLISEFEAGLNAYRSGAQALPPRVADGDLRPVLPLLDRLRDSPAGYATKKAGIPLSLGFGLSQADLLTDKGVELYRSALKGLLAPRLVRRAHDGLVAQLATPTPDADRVERPLTAYLGLSGTGSPDPAAVRGWVAEDLAAAGYGADEIRRIDAHLDTLLERSITRFEVSEAVLSGARAVLREAGPARRGYALLRRRVEAAQPAPWRVADHGGPEVARAFLRPSGAKLTDGIPGLYTQPAFVKTVLPELPKVARAIQDSAWLLDESPGQEPTGPLEAEILTLYLRDYAARWDGLLDDLALVKAADLRQVADLVNLLSGRSSPLRLLLQSVAEQTALTRLPKLPDAVPGASAVTSAVASGAEAPAAAALQQVALSTGPLAQAAQIVDGHFRLLNDFATGNPSRLDDLAKALETAYADLNRLIASRNQRQSMLDAAATGSEAFVRLTGDAASMPYPVKGWVEQLAKGQSAATLENARVQLNAEWQSTVLPWCRRALDGRYPFVRGAAAEVALDDFVRMFAPGGQIDGFFRNRLSPYVDTSGTAWRWQRVDGVDLGIPPSVLVPFQQAARIRDAFFPDGGKEPRSRFDVKATAIDPAVEQVGLTVDGQSVAFRKDSPQAFQVQWPGAAGARQVLVSFTAAAPPATSPAGSPPAASPAAAPPTPPTPLPTTVSRDGPWAFLRMVEGAGLRRTRDPNRFLFALSDGQHPVTFELRAGSALNPLTLDDLKDFRCPAQL